MKFDKMDKKQKKQIIRAFSLIIQLGLNMAVCIGLGLFMGRFLDNLLGTMPLFLIIFMLLGIVAAFKNMFQMLSGFFG